MLGGRGQNPGTGVIWDVDPNVTDEIYMDLGVGELTDEIYENINPKKSGVEAKSGKRTRNVGNSKQPVIQTTPSPSALRESHVNHIHNGQNCSCKRRILASIDDNDDPDPFSFLSDEVILSVFRWLSKATLTHCAKVCRRWRRLAYDDDLWRRVDLSSRTFRPCILGMILRRGVMAAKLSRSSIDGPVFDDDVEDDRMEDDSEDIVQSKLSRCSLVKPCPLHLESLDLSVCITNDPSTLQRIVEQCPALKRLSLESCDLDPSTLRAIANCGASLQVLNLAMCRLSSDEELLPMISNAQQLTSLNLSWVNISGPTLHQLLFQLSPNLHHLNMSGYRDKLKDEDVGVLVMRCPSVRELDLSDSTALTANCVGGIIRNCSQLEHLSLSRCYDIPHFGFGSLAEIKSLRALDVFGLMQDRQMERLKAQLPRVQLNAFPFSSIARPTFSAKMPRHIWGIECEV